MLQLQHLDQNGDNLGGLYVKKEEIAAVYAKHHTGGSSSHYIVLRSGKEFRTVQTVAELLDLINS